MRRKLTLISILVVNISQIIYKYYSVKKHLQIHEYFRKSIKIFTLISDVSWRYYNSAKEFDNC